MSRSTKQWKYRCCIDKSVGEKSFLVKCGVILCGTLYIKKTFLGLRLQGTTPQVLKLEILSQIRGTKQKCK